MNTSTNNAMRPICVYSHIYISIHTYTYINSYINALWRAEEGAVHLSWALKIEKEKQSLTVSRHA